MVVVKLQSSLIGLIECMDISAFRGKPAKIANEREELSLLLNVIKREEVTLEECIKIQTSSPMTKKHQKEITFSEIFKSDKMFFAVCLMFEAFPQRKDAIFESVSNKETDINVISSGSIGLYIDGKCKITSPNFTLYEDRKLDWCSNIQKSNNEKPWITYSIRERAMRVKGYSVRTGCCYYACCCYDDSNLVSTSCCCDLYSYSLQGSNDNSTWKIIHKMEKVDYVDYCKLDTFDFPLTESFKFIRFVLDEPRPGCEKCMAINQFELYGEVLASYSTSDIDNDDESISIIGKVRKSSE